jgi:light-regulated signal transduction histidine kinase (bacteriophytochrome)
MPCTAPMQTSGRSDETAKQPHDDRRLVREWQQFLETAVHDLNAPLRGIATSAALIAQTWGSAPNEDAHELMERLQEGVAKMKALLKGLAEYAAVLEVDDSSFVPVPLDAVLRSTLATLAPTTQKAGATIDFAPLPKVIGNWEHLSALFHHLLLNAVQCCPDASLRVVISAERDLDNWRIAVRDNGPGIDARYLQLILEPFQRLQGSDQPGAGLGLSTCRKIVELHGGRIWVESQLGAGSTILFTLPAAAA